MPKGFVVRGSDAAENGHPEHLGPTSRHGPGVAEVNVATCQKR